MPPQSLKGCPNRYTHLRANVHTHMHTRTLAYTRMPAGRSLHTHTHTHTPASRTLRTCKQYLLVEVWHTEERTGDVSDGGGSGRRVEVADIALRTRTKGERADITL